VSICVICGLKNPRGLKNPFNPSNPLSKKIRLIRCSNLPVLSAWENLCGLSAKPCVHEKNGGIIWRLTKKVLILQPKTTHHFNGTMVKQVDEQKSLYMMRQAACSRTIIGYARLKGSQ